MLKNNFRIKRKFIKENLITSFTATNFNGNNYVKTSIPYEWTTIYTNPKVRKINSSDYEETLISFIKSKSEHHNHPCLIIIGDVGSGKSSSLKYALSKAKKCHSCTDDSICNHKPMIIRFDFLKEDLSFHSEQPKNIISGNEDEDFEENNETCETFEEFWKLIFVELDKNISMSDEIERTQFWPWLLNDFRDHLYYNLYRVFLNYEQRIKNNELDQGAYDIIKNAIYLQTQPEHLLIYKLLQIAYCRRKHKGMCHIVIFDNLDSLEPIIQREALRISLKMNEILSSRSLIPMRPHTFSINSDAATFSEVLDHWSPNIFDVIHLRIKNMIEGEGESKIFGTYLLEVYNYIISSKYRKDLFVQTCGVSVRFALRNFYNFLLSPLIFWDEGKLNISLLDSNEFYQAYFCSELENQFLYDLNFVNIFVLKINNKGSIYSNLKLRILHLLSKNKDAGLTVRDIHYQMNNYGYNDTQICSGLNDMLRRKTSLIWSDTNIYYNESMLNEPHILSLTPIGEQYFESLLHSLKYMRECVTSKDKKREKYMEMWVKRCWAVFKELEMSDYKEIITYLEKSTAFSYQVTFDGPNSITLILWSKLLEEFKLYENRYKLNIDIEHENLMRKNILEILRTKMLTNFSFTPEDAIF